MSQTKIPVFYACDENFANYMIVSIHSLMKHASAREQYRIHILYTNLSPVKMQQIQQMENALFEIRFVNVGQYLESLHEKLPIRDYYSHTTYFRMFISDMFPEYEKVLYLDSDTVILGDIAELYHTELGDCYLGAAPEQVMRQIDTYGEYTEKVLGVNRMAYFNAGVLLIHCAEFRQNKLLEQFMELLYLYQFSVTQDEDYLNLLCQGRVLLLDQGWNTEVFGTIPVPEADIKLLHFIMTSKPWHVKDARFSEAFWTHAKETAVYSQILEELNTYTEEQRQADAASCSRLLQTARDEIMNENNYLNLKNSGKLKSYDRLLVLEKIARLEREGKFDVDVEDDPPTKELLPENIDYLRKKITSRIKAKFAFTIARSYMNKLIEDRKLIIKEIRGIEHFRNLSCGAIITCNHFNAFDSFAIQAAYDASGHEDRKFFRVIREGNYTNFPGFYGILMRNCYTFPLSSNHKTMKKFMQSMDHVLQNGHFMLVYPEQSMWWNYRKPKPLKKGAFSFAARNRVPVLPCFITMQDSDILGDDGFYVQEYTIHVSEPIYPDRNKTAAENTEMMREKNFEIWKQIYEDTYHEPLVYSCNERDA